MTKASPTISVSFQPKNLFLLFLAGVGIYVLLQLSEVVITLFLAVLVMSAIAPGVHWMQDKLRVPRIAAILFSYCVILLLLSFVTAMIVPPLVREFPNLVTALNLPPIPENLMQMRFTLSEVGSFAQQLFSSLGTLFTVITSTFSGIFAFFTVLVMASYLMLDRERLHHKIAWLTTDQDHFRLCKEVIDMMVLQLGGWVRGEALLMLTIGLMTYIGLTLFGVPYALPLAFLAGTLEILPNLGPTVSAVPAVVITYLSLGPGMAALVLLLYIVIQQLENHLIVPKIMQDSVDVNPLTTIIVILSGFKLGGIMGALIAVPVYVTLRVVYSVWLREHRRTIKK